jgi:hypothetical protein
MADDCNRELGRRLLENTRLRRERDAARKQVGEFVRIEKQLLDTQPIQDLARSTTEASNSPRTTIMQNELRRRGER